MVVACPPLRKAITGIGCGPLTPLELLRFFGCADHAADQSWHH
jgi:hypothetical protein